MKKITALTLFLAVALWPPIAADADIVTTWFENEEARGWENPYASDAAALEVGEKIYMSQCIKCHGEEGRGGGVSMDSLQAKPPDFTNKLASLKRKDGESFWRIKTGKFEMPPFMLILSDDEIWKVVAYIRTMSP